MPAVVMGQNEIVSPEELLQLLKWYHMRVLVIDLQQEQEQEQVKPVGFISTSQWFPGLARELRASANTASAVYAILLNQTLQTYLTIAKPEVLIVYDEQGQNDGVAHMFVSIKQRLCQITECSEWHRLRHVRYLSGGREKFQSLFPNVCSTDMAGRSEAEELKPQPISVSPSDLPSVDVDWPSQVLSHLFVSGIKGTGVDTIISKQFKHVISIGDEPAWSIIDSTKFNKTIISQTFTTPVVSPASPNSVITEVPISPSKKPVDITITQFELAQNYQITHYLFGVEDVSHAPIQRIFSRTNEIIAKAKSSNEKVLVHCHSGQSRSSSVVIAYLMSVGMSLAEAFSLVYQCRPCIKPNSGFWERLESYETDLIKKKTLDLTISNDNEHMELMQFLSTKSTLPSAQYRSIHPKRISQLLEFRKLCV